MSANRTDELLEGLAAGCERLVHPSVTDATVRGRQARFIGMLIAFPLLLSAVLAMLLPPVAGATATLAAIAAAFTCAWSAAALVAMSGGTWRLEAVGLVLAAFFLAGLVAAAGGLTSPVLLLILALPFEAGWLLRSRRAAWIAASASLAVIPLQAIPGSFLADAGIAAAAWHWLPPLFYAGFALPRAVAWVAESGRQEAQSASPRLEELIDAVELGLTLAGEVADVSPQARRLLGVAPELVLADGLFDRIHVADRVGYLCALTELRHDAGQRRVELRLRSPAGRDRPGEYRPFLLDMLRPAGGERIIALLRSNEELAGLRASLAASRESAESLEIAKSRILAAVSHELRTPLNAIIGFSDMLLCEMFGVFRDARQKEYVGLISQSGRHLLAVVNSMLDVSRIEAGAYVTHPEPFRFCDAVETSRSMIAAAAAAKCLDVSVDVGPELGDIDADRHAVQQMLLNLLSNAIKFTPEGGRVAIGARRAGSRLGFWVSDTGIGMSAEELALVGRPFVQVQNDYTKRFEGTGLGLSLVKGLVALHEGAMDIESEPGNGTTVTISLPLERPSVKQSGRSGKMVSMPANTCREALDGTFRKTA